MVSADDDESVFDPIETDSYAFTRACDEMADR